jgi:Ca2+-binding RTX toxin-like protein
MPSIVAGPEGANRSAAAHHREERGTGAGSTVLERRPSVRQGTFRRIMAACTALGLASFVVGLSAVPAWAVTCSGGGTMTIDVAGGESATISLNGAQDPRTIDVSPSDPSCGSFDTSNVTTIQVNGTAGNETFTISQAGSAPFPHQNTNSIELALGGGSDTLPIVGQATADAIGLGRDGISLDGGSTPDVTGIGSVENLFVAAGGGDDTVSGKQGDGLGGDLRIRTTITGGVGGDTLTGGRSNDFIGGGDGSDSLKGAKGADTVSGGRGNDVVSGGGGKDAVSGGAKGDLLKGGGDGDTIGGGDGNDTATAGGGPDVVSGGPGNDGLDGGPGDDHLKGEDGRDQLSGDKGSDLCKGGPDPDSITGCEHGSP